VERPHDVARWRERIRAEYSDMPGIQLTRGQISQLWNVDLPTCGAVLKALVKEGFLMKNPNETYVLARVGMATAIHARSARSET
jgi:DNA-binding GntR family transcriptional regulator